MSRKLLLLALPFISANLSAAPACDWHHLSTKSIPVHQDQLILERFGCTIPNWDTRDIADTYKATILKSDGSKIALENGDRYEAIHLLMYGDDFPLHALSYSSPGASTVGNSIRVYNGDWQQLAHLYNPINEWQANNRDGSERKVVGFFKVNDRYYIENLKSLGGDCMACMEHVIETYRATANGLERVDVREWDIATYQPFGNDPSSDNTVIESKKPR